MFDEKKEPEDIFSGTDPLAGSQRLNQPPPSMASAQPRPNLTNDRPTLESAMAAPSGPSSNRKLVVIAIIVVAIVLALLATLIGLWIVRSGQTPATNNEETTAPIIPPSGQESNSGLETTSDETTDIETTQEPTTTTPSSPTGIDQPPTPTDTDNDGLTDEEEVALGTSPNNPDTDGDGLNDSEEVRVWNTDPLNPDSDGDTFTDGSEVDNGYDPNQAGGILLDVKV